MLTIRRPNREFMRLSREFDDLFNGRIGGTTTASVLPTVDIQELEGQYILTADLPGLSKSDIEIKVDNDVLTLSGNRETDENESGYIFRERRTGSFERSFQLGRGIESVGIEANYKNGVLTVLIPKKAELQARQIPVTIH